MNPLRNLSNAKIQAPLKAKMHGSEATDLGKAYNARWESIRSKHLNREVNFEIMWPSALKPDHRLPLLVLNDGQDSEAVEVLQTVEAEVAAGSISPCLIVGIAAADRMAEYGTAFRPDYQRRGAKAAQYTAFLMDELLPLIESRFNIAQDPALRAIAGYSLGGLSAVDIAWNHPSKFGLCGAFSGSFWWRRHTLIERIFGMDAGRLMHLQIRKSRRKKALKFWLQAGTHDEESDRNNNGIIDAIDDTLDLMHVLGKKGYRPYYDFVYHEVAQGEHNPATWKLALPHFLRWAFGK